MCLDGTFQWTGAKLHIITLCGNEGLCFVSHGHVITKTLNSLVEITQFDIYNLLDGFKIQLVEGDNIIHTVQELRREMLTQTLLDDVAGIFFILIICRDAYLSGSETNAMTKLFQLTGTNIRGHNDHRIAEVHQTTITICQSTFIQHLQEHVEHIAMGLLDLIQQNDRVGTTTNTLCQLSTFLITDISRRCTHQTRGIETLRILTHIDTDERISCAKHDLCQFLG